MRDQTDHTRRLFLILSTVYLIWRYNDSKTTPSFQTFIVYGGTENVPKKKNSWIIFHLIPSRSSCKIVFDLENWNKILRFLPDIHGPCFPLFK